MIFDTVFHPTSSFESAFSSGNNKKALLTVSLAGLFLSIGIFLLTSNIIYSVFAFFLNIINWVVLSGIVFFFEFVHARKKSKSSVNGFVKSSSAVGVLWEINLLAYFLISLGAGIIPIFRGFLLNAAIGVLFVLLIFCAVVWIIASFKMLKVVFKAENGKLVLNWIILMLLNSLVSVVVSNLLSTLLF
jgi:hypothetical protein